MVTHKKYCRRPGIYHLQLLVVMYTVAKEIRNILEEIYILSSNKSYFKVRQSHCAGKDYCPIFRAKIYLASTIENLKRQFKITLLLCLFE